VTVLWRRWWRNLPLSLLLLHDLTASLAPELLKLEILEVNCPMERAEWQAGKQR